MESFFNACSVLLYWHGSTSQYATSKARVVETTLPEWALLWKIPQAWWFLVCFIEGPTVILKLLLASNIQTVDVYDVWLVGSYPPIEITVPDFSRRQCPALVSGRSTGPFDTWPLGNMVSVVFNVSFGVQPPIEKIRVNKIGSKKVDLAKDSHNIKCQHVSLMPQEQRSRPVDQSQKFNIYYHPEKLQI